MKVLSALVLGLGLSSAALATQPYKIEVTRVAGKGCPDPSQVTVDVSPLGNYVIKAAYNEAEDVFVAESSPEKTTVRSDCTIDYKLILAPGYKLDFAQFQIDGQYNLSETGTAFFSVRHNVPGLANPVFQNASYSASKGDAPEDNFVLTGSIDGIDERVNTCGGTIPLQVQVRATARQAASDSLTTFVAVDNGEGSANAKRGYRRIACEVKPVPCQ